MGKGNVRKDAWRIFWKIHDIKKKLEEHLKARLDRLSPKARLVTVLTMFSVFAVLALYTFGKAVYDIGKNDGKEMEIEHIRQLELAPPKRSINQLNNNYNGTERRAEQESGNFHTDGRTEERETALD
jgi:hypothetical protein